MQARVQSERMQRRVERGTRSRRHAESAGVARRVRSAERGVTAWRGACRAQVVTQVCFNKPGLKTGEVTEGHVQECARTTTGTGGAVPSAELVDVEDGVGEAPGAVVVVRAEGLPAEEAEGVPGVPRRVVRRGYHLHHAPHDLVALGGVRGEDGRRRPGRS